MKLQLLILAVSLTATFAFYCPKQCSCGTGDELDYFCTVGSSNVSFQGRKNEYVNIKCFSNKFTCADLPTFNFAKNLTLPDLGVTGCSPTILRCVNQVLQFSSVTKIVLTNASEPLVKEDVQELGDVEEFIMRTGVETAVPTDAINAIPSLTSFRITGNPITLNTSTFAISKPLQFLELSDDEINQIPDGTFEGLSMLETLNMFGNNFSSLSVNSFKGLDSLQKLFLNTNNLETIPPGAFSHMPKLQEISFMGDELTELPTGLIYNLPDLENISITFNYVELKLKPKALSELPSLKNLILESSQITTLPADLIAGDTALKTFSMAYNSITAVPEEFFKGLSALETINLSFNRISSLTADMFSTLKNLKTLDLNRNHLEVLPDYLFSGLRNLNSLSMDYNLLTTIGSDTFQGAVGLTTISMAGNRLALRRVDQEYMNLQFPYSPFNMLVALKKLDLSGNRIDNMFEDWRMVLLNLEDLDLSWNNFSTLLGNDCQFLSDKVIVNLQHNNINTIYLGHATKSPNDSQSPSDTQSPHSKPAKNQSKILLDNNPLNCDCDLYNLAIRLQGAKPITVEPEFVLGNARCSLPPNLEGDLFREVSLYDLNCELPPNDCYNSCSTCQIRPAKNDLDFDCITIPPSFPPAIENVGISLKLKSPPKYIGNLSLELLNLTNIGLKEIPFAPSNGVKVIDFSNNNLNKIPIEFLKSNTTLYLSNNPFECQCWYSEEISMLQKSVLVNDLDKVICDNGDKLIKVDVLALCSTWRAAAVASGTFIALILIVFFIVITIYRYTHEILVYITSKGLCPCFFIEDISEAEKEYDVFISYAHKDRKYFLELLPKLESEFGQKTCVHYRDWSVGDLIPDQITRSVESSRRTVILLSSNFLESNYANMEFRTAHNLALKEGKTRVILILIEDVTKHEKLSEELKAYIKTNTYLTWDDPQFWQRLYRALPMRNNKKFVLPHVFKQGGKQVQNLDVKSGLDVHLNSQGQLVNVAVVKDVI